MALQGTLKDFGLGDIFQLIGIQRKTGVLTLENDQDTVLVKFLEGQVVGADTRARTLEDLLGSVLVRTGRLPESQLHDALAIQKKTLQRLGHVLVQSKMISEDDLVEALRVQSLQIVYRLFRWQEGSFVFAQQDDLEYDEKHFTPISSETILMEGARMVDEWPIIARRVYSDKMVLRQTEAAQELELEVESIVDTDLDFDFGFDQGESEKMPAAPEKDEASNKVKLSAEEGEILHLVDGTRTVEEICDRCAMGEFDTHRLLAELITRHLIEETRQETDTGPTGVWERFGSRALGWALTSVVWGAAALSLFTLSQNPFTPWRVLDRDPATASLRYYASQGRMERIDRAIQVFYLDAGTFPSDLVPLASNGYLTEDDLRDPWGRRYGYELGLGGYRILGLSEDGEPDPELDRVHRFTRMQRAMMDPGSAETEETTE
ncbi:MAG: DUF4388 domain-containing protein [bacterium]|nr:DUF4388 domain-containing protein [bacterium]